MTSVRWGIKLTSLQKQGGQFDAPFITNWEHNSSFHFMMLFIFFCFNWKWFSFILLRSQMNAKLNLGPDYGWPIWAYKKVQRACPSAPLLQAACWATSARHLEGTRRAWAPHDWSFAEGMESFSPQRVVQHLHSLWDKSPLSPAVAQ